MIKAPLFLALAGSPAQADELLNPTRPESRSYSKEDLGLEDYSNRILALAGDVNGPLWVTLAGGGTALLYRSGPEQSWSDITAEAITLLTENGLPQTGIEEPYVGSVCSASDGAVHVAFYENFNGGWASFRFEPGSDLGDLANFESVRTAFGNTASNPVTYSLDCSQIFGTDYNPNQANQETGWNLTPGSEEQLLILEGSDDVEGYVRAEFQGETTQTIELYEDGDGRNFIIVDGGQARFLSGLTGGKPMNPQLHAGLDGVASYCVNYALNNSMQEVCWDVQTDAEEPQMTGFTHNEDEHEESLAVGGATYASLYEQLKLEVNLENPDAVSEARWTLTSPSGEIISETLSVRNPFEWSPREEGVHHIDVSFEGWSAIYSVRVDAIPTAQSLQPGDTLPPESFVYGVTDEGVELPEQFLTNPTGDLLVLNASYGPTGQLDLFNMTAHVQFFVEECGEVSVVSQGATAYMMAEGTTGNLVEGVPVVSSVWIATDSGGVSINGVTQEPGQEYLLTSEDCSEVVDPDPDPDPAGCGCARSGQSGAWFFLLGLGLAVRRRTSL